MLQQVGILVYYLSLHKNNRLMILDQKGVYLMYLKILFYLIFIVEILVFIDLIYKKSLQEENNNLFFVYKFLMKKIL
jgi:hypothetical protein